MLLSTTLILQCLHRLTKIIEEETVIEVQEGGVVEVEGGGKITTTMVVDMKEVELIIGKMGEIGLDHSHETEAKVETEIGENQKV